MPSIIALPLLVVAAAAAKPIAVQRVDTGAPLVALTFDACATGGQPNGFDRAVYDILVRERVPATIFLSGRWIEAHPQEARLLATTPLFEVGNHGYGHQQMSALSRTRVVEEIELTERAIASLGRKSIGFRPPFGDWDRKVAAVAESRGLPTILWDVVSGDAGGHFRTASIVDQVTRRTRPGSIVIFHINGRGPHTAAALPTILSTLRARGLRFVRVSELLASGANPVAARPAKYNRNRADRKG